MHLCQFTIDECLFENYTNVKISVWLQLFLGDGENEEREVGKTEEERKSRYLNVVKFNPIVSKAASVALNSIREWFWTQKQYCGHCADLAIGKAAMHNNNYSLYRYTDCVDRVHRIFHCQNESIYFNTRA